MNSSSSPLNLHAKKNIKMKPKITSRMASFFCFSLCPRLQKFRENNLLANSLFWRADTFLLIVVVDYFLILLSTNVPLKIIISMPCSCMLWMRLP